MKSRLSLSTEYKYGKTVIKDLYCNPPYRIMSPFMDGDKMEVCLMSSSAGMLAGDEFGLYIDIGDKCNLRFVSQSYEKILDTKDDKARKKLEVNVGANATLEYMPYPMIPFTGSDYFSENIIRLQESSIFTYSDIFSCGRVGMGEKYGLKSYKANTKVYIGKKLAFCDNTVIVPDKIKYDKLGFWGDYTHNGMLYIYSNDTEKLQNIVETSRAISLKDEIYSGSTLCANGIVIRSMGYSGEELFLFNKKIMQRACNLLKIHQ